MKKSSSLILIAIALVALILLGFHYWPLRSTTSSETPWLTQTNTQYGYEFKYPANFPPTTELPPSGFVNSTVNLVHTFGIDFPKLATNGTNLTHLSMWVVVLPVRAQECVEMVYGNPITAFSNSVSTSTSLLGGEKFVKVAGINDAGAGQFWTTEYYAAMHNNLCYRLALVGRGFNDIVTHNQDHPEDLVRPYDVVPLDMIFSQIAAKFKFTK